MAKMPTGQPPRFVENLHAPEIFADACVGVFLQNGFIHLTFASFRTDYSTQPNTSNAVVMARLVIPVDAADNMQQFLAKFLSDMNAQAAGGRAQGARTFH